MITPAPHPNYRAASLSSMGESGSRQTGIQGIKRRIFGNGGLKVMTMKKQLSRSVIDKWHEQVSEYVRRYGPVVQGHGPVQFHHVKGRTFRHRKVHIGQWWIIPLPYELHDISSNHEANVTYYKKRFEDRYGKQSLLWRIMIERMEKEMDLQLPFGQDVIDAVMDL